MDLGYGRSKANSAILPDKLTGNVINSQNRYAGMLGKLRAEKQKKDEISLKDFKPDFNNLLPPYANDIIGIYKEGLQKVMAIQDANKFGGGEGDINRAILETGQRIDKVRVENDAAMAHEKFLDTHPEYIKEQAAFDELHKPDATYETASKALSSLQDKGIIYTPQGRLSMIPVKKAPVVVKYNPDDLNQTAGTPRGAAFGQNINPTNITLKPEAFKAKVDENFGNPDIYAFYAYQLPADKKKDKATLDAAVLDVITEEVRKQSPELTPTVKEVFANAPVLRESLADKEASKSAAKINGNTVTIGNAIWSYFSDGDTETFVPSRTDATENKQFYFERQNGKDKETLYGRLKYITIGKNGKPEIHIMVSMDFPIEGGKMVKEDIEEVVPYNVNNASKIKNEYNSNPYEIRKMFTGSASILPSAVTTGTTAKGTNSNLGTGSVKQKSKAVEVSLETLKTKGFSDKQIKNAIKEGKIKLIP